MNLMDELHKAVLMTTRDDVSVKLSEARRIAIEYADAKVKEITPISPSPLPNKSKEEILTEFGCPQIPFDENVTMYYPAILSAMDEYAEQFKSSKQMTDEDIGQAFDNHFDCYTKWKTSGDAGEEQAMTKAKFIEVVRDLLTKPKEK